MKRSLSILLFAAFVAVPGWTIENLPVPLRLPPGLRQTLSINKEISYAGDAVKIPIAPAMRTPLRHLGNTLFGGLAMWDSQSLGLR